MSTAPLASSPVATRAASPPPPSTPNPSLSPISWVISDISLIFQCWFRGLRDALDVRHIYRSLKASPTIRSRVVKCIALNGIIFVGSLLAFEFIVIPLLHTVLNLPDSEIETTTFASDDVDVNNNNTNSSILDDLAYKSIASSTQSYFKLILSALYHICWLFPVYVMSFLFNASWLQEIAKKAYDQTHAKSTTKSNPPTQQKPAWIEIPRQITEEIYRTLLYAIFLIQCVVLLAIPFIGPFLNFVYLSWIYSLYCFEYKWALKGGNWNILSFRLAFFENHWAYFLGFGTPFTLACYFFPYLLSYGIYALIFPFFIIVAQRGQPPLHKDLRYIPSHLPIFKISQYANDKLLVAVQGPIGTIIAWIFSLIFSSGNQEAKKTD